MVDSTFDGTPDAVQPVFGSAQSVQSLSDLPYHVIQGLTGRDARIHRLSGNEQKLMVLAASCQYGSPAASNTPNEFETDRLLVEIDRLLQIPDAQRHVS